MARPVAVWNLPYEERYAGVRALHNLVGELQSRGVSAYHGLARSADHIQVFPEIVEGNPSVSKHVVRWLLNTQQFRAGSNDLIVAWDTVNPEKPLLCVDVFNAELFYPKDEPGKGSAVWIGKGRTQYGYVPRGAFVITRDYPTNRREVADLLRSVDTLVSFDPMSCINIEAMLCGTKVLCPHPLKLGLWGDAMVLGGEAHKRLANLLQVYSASVDDFVDSSPPVA